MKSQYGSYNIISPSLSLSSLLGREISPSDIDPNTCQEYIEKPGDQPEYGGQPGYDNGAHSCDGADIPSASAPTAGAPARCVVCGESAPNKHFGVRACNACAAFFRRTVTLQKSYLCRRGKNCALHGTEPRHMCRFCRFQRCIHSGMNISAVMPDSWSSASSGSSGSSTSPARSSGSEASPGGSPGVALAAVDEPGFLGRVMAARRAVFVNRNRATVHVYGGHDRVVRTANRYKVASSTFFAISAEMIVASDFLRACDLLQIEADWGLHRQFFLSWILCECLLTTVRNVGHRTGQHFFVDESFVTPRYDELLKYYLSDPSLRHPDAVSRNGVEYFRETIALAARFHEARLDDTERAALFFIFTTYSMAKERGLSVVSELAQEVMRELKRHYERNYDDVAVRLGNLILLLGEFQRVRHLFDEHIIFQQISGKTAVFDRLTLASQPVL